jgi:hypothetical protein
MLGRLEPRPSAEGFTFRKMAYGRSNAETSGDAETG